MDATLQTVLEDKFLGTVDPCVCIIGNCSGASLSKQVRNVIVQNLCLYSNKQSSITR